MEKTDMPANISYTLLVHAGSYKDFTKKMERDYADLEIKSTKRRAVHYYLVLVSENGKTEYKKEDIYKLPIMAMREEFSNYVFFKSVKAYNNVLKIMCGGKDNDKAPYQLFEEMLTPIEKYKYGEVDKSVKSIGFTKINENNTEVSTTIFGQHAFDAAILSDIFEGKDFKVDDKEIDLVELLKAQNLKIGIV